VTNTDPYIKQITALGDTNQVVVVEDICNVQGVSLVKRGTQLDSTFYNRLVSHKLLRPIDHSLSVEDPVTSLSLVVEAKRLLTKEPGLAKAVGNRFIERDLLIPLGRVHLEPQLAFKLTVCREQSLKRFQHMLRVTLIALHIASQLSWSINDRIQLAAASIFHDLGEMHLDPTLFNNQPLTSTQRRQIFSHPIIAYLFLKEFPAYHPQISLAVLQHHERIDGSGYPNGVSGNHVVPAARVIGASELLIVTRLKTGAIVNRHFSTKEVLTFNSEKFGNDVILPLIEAAKRIGNEADTLVNSKQIDKRTLQSRMNLLLEIKQGALDLDTSYHDDMTAFISKQLERISEMAKRCGADLYSPEDLLELIGEDDIALSELDALVREMIYLVQSTAREAMRRWVKDELLVDDQEPLAMWLRHAEMAIHSAELHSE
jgi:hypothetical protein